MLYNGSVSLVIPALNEGKNLQLLLRKIPDCIDEVIVVDGYSSDDTVDVAKRFGCKVLYGGIGKGSALIKGINASRGDFIITMDADFSHRPLELDALIKGLANGYDICLGSRFMAGGGSEDISAVRRIGNKFFVFMVNLLFGSNYTDLCYGYRSFRRASFNRLGLKCSGFSIETEICIKAAKNGMKTLEVPSFEKRRKYGKGKLRTVRDGLSIAKLILKEAFIGRRFALNLETIDGKMKIAEKPAISEQPHA